MTTFAATQIQTAAGSYPKDFFKIVPSKVLEKFLKSRISGIAFCGSLELRGGPIHRRAGTGK